MDTGNIIPKYLIALFLFFIGYTSTNAQNTSSTNLHPQASENGIMTAVDGRYLLSLPKQYEEANEPWPLILFLHGRGERGNDLNLLKPHLPPMIEDEQEDFPFILVAPQLPLTELWWSNDSLKALLDEVIAEYRVNEDRIYLTGYSMGGYGTWSLAVEYPEIFAAIAPICGGGEPDLACRIKDIPAWVVHGASDETVPIERSEEMVDAIRECGGNVRFIVFPELGHGGWSETYSDPEFIEWLKNQCKQGDNKKD